jgi:hypothetical protein
MNRPAGSHYDVVNRTIYIAPNDTLYAHFHEQAHAEQHRQWALVFVAWVALHRVRWIGLVFTYLVELDAMNRARSAMRHHGLWTKEVEQEARTRLRSYVWRR